LTSAGPAASANGCATHGPASLPPFLAALVEGLGAANAFELDARLRRVIRLEQQLLAEMGPLLLEVACSRSYRRLRLCERGRLRPRVAGDVAAQGAGPPPAGVRRPAPSTLREAYRSGRLSWTQAHALVPILGLDHAAPWRERWIAQAERVTVRRLEEDVERALVTGALDPEARPEADPGEDFGADPDQAQTGAQPRAAQRLETLFFTAPADVARLFRAVLATVQRRIEHRNGRLSSESEALDAMLEHCFETWVLPNVDVPPEHRVFERDGWRCTVPGCTSYRNLHDHHIRFRSAGGSDHFSNRTTLCAAHHLRGVHTGLIRIRGCAPEGLRFELPLATYGPGERLVSP
jgi:hypothetical protein